MRQSSLLESCLRVFPKWHFWTNKTQRSPDASVSVSDSRTVLEGWRQQDGNSRTETAGQRQQDRDIRTETAGRGDSKNLHGCMLCETSNRVNTQKIYHNRDSATVLWKLLVHFDQNSQIHWLQGIISMVVCYVEHKIERKPERFTTIGAGTMLSAHIIDPILLTSGVI